MKLLEFPTLQGMQQVGTVGFVTTLLLQPEFPRQRQRQQQQQQQQQQRFLSLEEVSLATQPHPLEDTIVFI